MNKKIVAPVALVTIAALLSGCGATIGGLNLPAITAEEIHYVRKDTAGGTDIHITNLDSTSNPDKVTADSVSVTTTYPFVNFSIVLKKYQRTKTAEEKK